MAVPAPLTDQEIADKLTRDGSWWYGDNGDMTIEYSFSASLGYWWGNNSEYQLDATQQQWIETALVQLEDMFGFNFVEVAEPANTSGNSPTDIIQFVNDDNTGTYSSSYSYTSGPNTDGIVFNAIVFDDTWGSNQSANLDYGSYGFMTMLHEILHSLGLDHPGDYNAGSGSGPITYAGNAEFEQDTHRYTVMSYFNSYEDASGAIFYDVQTGDFVYPRTPMVYDILAMTDGSFNGNFNGYAGNATTRNTDTTYGHNATTGIDAAYDFDAHGAPVLTIYDTGGIDTLDLSGDTVTTEAYMNYDANDLPTFFSTRARTDTLIDLREGQYSSTHGMTYNIGIAFGTVIENAIGTQFHDTIHGNTADNSLDGGSAGNDTIYGYGGDDFLDGGSGSDRLFGGEGNDTIVYDSVNELDNINGGNGFDTLLFELIWLSVDLIQYGFEQSALQILDFANEAWDIHTKYFNTDELLTEEIINMDNGFTNHTVYDVNDSEYWSEWKRVFDSENNIIEEFYINDEPDSPPIANADYINISERNLSSVSGNLIDNDSGVGIFVDMVNGVSISKIGETEISLNIGSLFIKYNGEYRFIQDYNAKIFDTLDDGEFLLFEFEYTVSNSLGSSQSVIQINVEGNTYETIEGNKRDNKIFGTENREKILGYNGSDKLFGAEGADFLDGGTGSDRVNGGSGDDIVYGAGGRDILRGGDGDDVLEGGNGRDKLFGNAGSDILYGGIGRDSLFGGDDSDLFVLSDTGTRDTIFDFVDGEDFLVSDTIYDFEDLIFKDTKKGTLITTENGDVNVHLIGIHGALDQSDFIPTSDFEI